MVARSANAVDGRNDGRAEYGPRSDGIPRPQLARGHAEELRVERARWDRADAEWSARLARDTTGTIAAECAKYGLR